MRILLVHSYYRLRGGEDVVFEAEAEMLEAHGHEVIRYTKRNEELVGQGQIAKIANTIWNRQISQELRQIILEHRIDVAHFHNTFPAISPLPIRTAHRSGAVTVLTLHNSRPLCAAGVCFRDRHPCTICVGKSIGLPAIQHACFHDSVVASGVVVLNNWVHRTHRTLQKYLDVAIAPTQFVRQRYEDANYPISRIVVKPHFVERHLVAGDGKGGYALFVGRLSEEKGLRTLIDAWSKLRAPMTLKIIGQGPLENELKRFAHYRTANTAHDASSHDIEYLGQLSQADVYDAMGDAAVLILPSHCAESFGRVVIESYAKGTPVICANQGGQAELVHPGVGATFRSGDPDDLARVVDSLISDPSEFNSHPTSCRVERLQAMRPLARLEYEKHYTEALNYQLLQRIYADAIAGRWPQRPLTSMRISNDNNSHCDHELGRRTPTRL